MTKKEIASLIEEGIYTLVDEEIIDNNVDTSSFGSAGVMTNDEGIVIRIDGEVFYITIQKR